MIRVVDGSPYTVPVGRVYVVSGVGVNSGNNAQAFGIRFDNVTVLEGTVQGVLPVPPGLVAPAGTLITAGSNDVILGYLGRP